MTDSRVPLLEIEELAVEFRTRMGTVYALDQVHLHVMRGETVGIVGESGSGKSVLAYAVMGILDPAARIMRGRIVFGGLDVVTAGEEDLAQQRGRELSMIFQRHANIVRADVKSRGLEMLARVQIADPERCYSAYPFELSGGMCQRILIAMALACAPALLIADEPTTGLDVVTQATIMDLIKELALLQRMATLFITHDLGLATRYCERIVVMHAGHVVEMAATKELFTAPRPPYTAKLIAATPRATMKMADLAAIPGSLPDLRRPLPPCRYSARCERYSPACDTAPLPYTASTPGHMVACWRPL